MSCNGCRVLRKGCSETCILRPCLQWIDTPESQGHATVFVAKFFGRAGLMSFISNVPPLHRPALFQSLLYEACGRTVNPVTGAVGLLWSGNWHVCQAAVDTVLRGGTLRPIADFLTTAPPSPPTTAAEGDEASEVVCPPHLLPAAVVQDHNSTTYSQSQSPPPRFSNSKRRKPEADQLDLGLTPVAFPRQRPGTPSLNSEESATTQCGGMDQYHYQYQVNVSADPILLNLFI